MPSGNLERRIAKHLLLGHSKRDIVKLHMPRYHVEGQKRVGLGDVRRIFELLNSDKQPKLRQGLDAISLVAKDDQESCLKGVYPWPPDENLSSNVASTPKKSHLVPLQNTKVSKAPQKKSQVSPKKIKRNYDETDHAVATIVEITTNNDDQAADGGQDDTFIETVTEEAEVSTVSDDAIDQDAFQVNLD